MFSGECKSFPASGPVSVKLTLFVYVKACRICLLIFIHQVRIHDSYTAGGLHVFILHSLTAILNVLVSCSNQWQ